uniref:Uncharacterized protein n=1 Tax=Setaria italica TaxID=4555 RepID=K3XUH5_SETIT
MKFNGRAAGARQLVPSHCGEQSKTSKQDNDQMSW